MTNTTQDTEFQAAESAYRGTELRSFRGANAMRDAYRAGMFLRAALLGDSEAQEYCRTHNIPFTRDHSGKDNASGGVFVIPEVERAIIDLRIQYGVFRRNSRVTPMASDTKLMPRRRGGLTAFPVGAGVRGTFSQASWDELELIARKWMVLTKMEDELNEDSIISFADILVSEIAYAFTFAEDNAGFNGDGGSNYHGIVGIIPKFLGIDANPANIKGLKIATGNAWSEITQADLLAVIGLLPQFARSSGNVKWYCSHEFWANVLQRVALAMGGVSYAEISGELKEVFMGKPVEFVEVMPNTEANSQICLLYGNMSQATTFGDRRGVTIKQSDSNDKDFEADVQTIKGTERFDINVHDVGDTEQAGALVGLMTAGS